jgi:[ribosomal protein S5]-alanine N-acetyltransferase
MKIHLETPRLILREIVATDIDGLYLLDADAEVHRYLGQQPVTDRAQLTEVIAFIRQQYSDHGIGRWAVIAKVNAKFIGWAGLKWMTSPCNGHVHYYDLGYRFIRSVWGQGYATEAAQALVAYAFVQRAATEVFAMADAGNGASRRVLEKAGLRYLETFIQDDAPHDWFRIGLAEWLAVNPRA